MKNKNIEAISLSLVSDPLKGQEIKTIEEIKTSKNPDESWCKNCQEFIYNFKQKKHCPKCRSLL